VLKLTSYSQGVKTVPGLRMRPILIPLVLATSMTQGPFRATPSASIDSNFGYHMIDLRKARRKSDLDEI
jgi:hypothetical protein